MPACHDCTCDCEQLARQNAANNEHPPTIVLAGNPNCGKTTIFNLLTGARQTVGNWPGVTVERRCGTVAAPAGKISVVDLPGVYSLLGGGGVDQKVAREFLLGEEVDVVVNIIDASNLERHLTLTAELLEIGKPMVVALNMIDEAQALGLEPQTALLSERLGVPVVAMVARKGRGRQDLLDAIQHALQHRMVGKQHGYDAALEAAIADISAALTGAPVARRFEALRLLEERVQADDARLAAMVADAQAAVLAACHETAADMAVGARFAWANETAALALRRRGAPGMRQRVTEILDKVVLNDWLGVPIFLLVLYLVFVVSYNGGMIFQDFFDQASSAVLIAGFGHLLLSLGLPDWLVSVLAGGIGGGLNLVVAFIPPIGLTFLFLAMLDDCGYMARAAYAMDRFMRRLGLPGNALVPMVIGFGCNVPAIMGSRIIEDARGRLLTILMQPFMSCSARLTIYMAFALVFFKQNGGQIVFLLYVLGIVVALFTAWLLGKTALRGRAMPFMMELPPYRLPGLRSVLLQGWQRLKVFIMRVGRVIVVIGVILFVLPGIGWTGKGFAVTDIDHSLLAQGSRALVPIFSPMGIEEDNWPAVSGLVAGAAAKEVVIGTLNGIYQRQNVDEAMAVYRQPDVLNKLIAAIQTVPENARAFFTSFGDPLGLHALTSAQESESASGASNDTLTALAANYTPLSAFAYMVFVLLYVPCASTLGALRREAGWGWMWFSAAYGVVLAWSTAVIIYQTGSFTAHPAASAAWIGGCALALFVFFAVLRLYGLRRGVLYGERVP